MSLLDPEPREPPLPLRKDALANRRALLEHATRIFSKQGYANTSVRQICGAAGLNIGAVNQHFGSKQNLYREVLVRAGRSLAEQEPCPRLEDFDAPADALHAWMDFHLTLVLLRRAADPVAGPLLMRELRNPTDAIEGLTRAVIQPIRGELVRIVGALLADADSPALRNAAANFVFGLGVFHGLAAPMLERLGQPPPTRKPQVEKLLARLYPFALGGIRAMRVAAD